MHDTLSILRDRFRIALKKAFGQEHSCTDPLIRASNNAKFGDYQANLAMSLAKTLGQNPRTVAGQIVDHLDIADLCAKVEIAGPGFINLSLTPAFIDQQIEQMAADGRLGVATTAAPRTIVVDYSSPNVAKEMHVGHLRSTIIGDCIARVLEFLGHRVVRQNHLGDWGTQFGMLIEYYLRVREIGDFRNASINANRLRTESDDRIGIHNLDKFYRAAKKRFDDDSEFAKGSRRRVVDLQCGDEKTLRLWRLLVESSKQHFLPIYEVLGVRLSDGDFCGESFYNEKLPGIVAGLEKAGLLQESEGAQVIYPPGFKNKEGEPLAMIVRKSDGGFLYATTDLAAIRYRVETLGADRVIYVTDARQAQHFAMVFTTARSAAWVNPEVHLEHVPFGTILGKDNKPFKTREGGVVRLADLLEESQQQAGAIIAEKNLKLPDTERHAIARAIGIGALKYADLSSDRIKDYVFDWERMLAFDGNTAPYLQNAYVRIQAIFRKAPDKGVNLDGLGSRAIHVCDPAEHQLALKLLGFPPIVLAVAESLEPHRLCTYLYDLASSFHQFYERCPVLRAEDAKRTSRLRLCELVGRTVKMGLGLLGIEVVERM